MCFRYHVTLHSSAIKPVGSCHPSFVVCAKYFIGKLSNTGTFVCCLANILLIGNPKARHMHAVVRTWQIWFNEVTFFYRNLLCFHRGTLCGNKILETLPSPSVTQCHISFTRIVTANMCVGQKVDACLRVHGCRKRVAGCAPLDLKLLFPIQYLVAKGSHSFDLVTTVGLLEKNTFPSWKKSFRRPFASRFKLSS